LVWKALQPVRLQQPLAALSLALVQVLLARRLKAVTSAKAHLLVAYQAA
jgi:hypothetical protein